MDTPQPVRRETAWVRSDVSRTHLKSTPSRGRERYCGAGSSRSVTTRARIRPHLEVGAVSLPFPGELVSGDAWAINRARWLHVRDGCRRSGARSSGRARGRRGDDRVPHADRSGTRGRHAGAALGAPGNAGRALCRSHGWTPYAARSATWVSATSQASSWTAAPAKPRAWFRRTERWGTRFAGFRRMTIRGARNPSCSCIRTACPPTGPSIVTLACPQRHPSLIAGALYRDHKTRP